MIIMSVLYIFYGFCIMLWQALMFCAMWIISLFVNKEEAKNEENDVPAYVYSELDAYQHQLQANYKLGERVIHDIKQAEFVGRLSPTEREKYDKKLADYEAKCAQIEKKIAKLGEKYNIDTD